jgi:hypothetical protein
LQVKPAVSLTVVWKKIPSRSQHKAGISGKIGNFGPSSLSLDHLQRQKQTVTIYKVSFRQLIGLTIAGGD